MSSAIWRMQPLLKGCYARANGIADNPGMSTRPTLTPEQWRGIFEEASELGINFAPLAGGRGFFHIALDGNAEPCPFSPTSDDRPMSGTRPTDKYLKYSGKNSEISIKIIFHLAYIEKILYLCIQNKYSL